MIKYTIALFAVMFALSTGAAQAQSALQVVSNTNELVKNTNELVKTTDTALEKAGEQLMLTTENVIAKISEAFPEIAGKGFYYYVEYVFAQGVATITIATALSLICLTGLFLIYKNVKAVFKEGDPECMVSAAFAGSILSIILFVLLCNALFDSADGLTAVIAPEGKAIREMVVQVVN